MFLNPANPEVSDFLIESYRYILENYDIDGLQLDYIRYPHNGTDTDYGYDDATLSAFESKYGVMPEYKPSESYWKDWCAFRASLVGTGLRPPCPRFPDRRSRSGCHARRRCIRQYRQRYGRRLPERQGVDRGRAA